MIKKNENDFFILYTRAIEETLMDALFSSLDTLKTIEPLLKITIDELGVKVVMSGVVNFIGNLLVNQFGSEEIETSVFIFNTGLDMWVKDFQKHHEIKTNTTVN